MLQTVRGGSVAGEFVGFADQCSPAHVGEPDWQRDYVLRSRERTVVVE
jgi:hypothetical protein